MAGGGAGGAWLCVAVRGCAWLCVAVRGGAPTACIRSPNSELGSTKANPLLRLRLPPASAAADVDPFPAAAAA